MKPGRLIIPLVLLYLSAAAPVPAAGIEVRGAYGGVQAFWDSGARLDDYGINAIFTGGHWLQLAQVARARAEGARVFAEFAALNGEEYVEKHPEAWPVDEKGERSPKAGWFMGVCPIEPGFRLWRMNELREMLRRLELDGIWMDYVHWHAQFEDPNPILPETCFCPGCLSAFQSATGVRLPEGGTAEKARWILEHQENIWRDWRCSVVTGWARDIKQIIRQERPGALLGLFHAPWTDQDFSGARRKILGLDFGQLAGVVDVFSPMVYHGRMGRDPRWVGEYVAWLGESLGIKAGTFPKVWPIVQATDEPAAVSPREFEEVLRRGASGAASGVMMFTVNAVAHDPVKLETLKKVYLEWAGKK